MVIILFRYKDIDDFAVKIFKRDQMSFSMIKKNLVLSLSLFDLLC